MADITWEGDVSGDWSVAGNWVGGVAPVNGDNVRIPATTTQAITAGLNQSAVTLADLIVEEGAPAVGTRTLSAITYLQVGISGQLRFSGAGTSFIDIGSSAVSARVHNTVTPATGFAGLYLKGSAIATLDVTGGYVALAWNMGETATASVMRLCGSGSRLWVGKGVTMTTVTVEDGTLLLHPNSLTTLNVNGGTVTTIGTASGSTITTVNQYAGTFYPNSNGTITTCNIFGGTCNFLTAGLARTVTNLKLDPGGILKYDPAVTTISNWTAPGSPIVLTTSRPITA